MTSVVFIADWFVEQVAGGGEINNDEFIKILTSQGYEVHKIQSHLVNEETISQFNNSVFIVANFINLSQGAKRALQDKSYVIYEHDHKYLKTRNPAAYPDFSAPIEQIINKDFYKSANAVLCQSSFHRDIVKKNLKIDNIVSLGGNLWSTEDLALLRDLSSRKKKNSHSIMESSIPHKNTIDSIRYCKAKNLDYELIPSLPYKQFLKRLGGNKALVFFPKTPETLSRIVVEARMMDMRVITNKLVGASREDWFKLRGEELIEVMEAKRQQIPGLVKNSLGL